MNINFEQNIGEQLKFAFEHNENISEEDVRELSYEPDEMYSLGSGRWMEHLYALYKSGDFYYGVQFDRGLTECQENEYYAQVPRKFERVEIKTYTFKDRSKDDQSANP
jgi:hypothetical protein